MSNVVSQNEATRKAIKQAFVRIKNNRPKVVNNSRKMSIASVAEESGFSRAMIHKYYPDIAEMIRGESGRDNRTQRNEKNELLKAEREKNRVLQKELKGMRERVRQLSSINATLSTQNNRFKALLDGDNIRVLSPK